MNVGKLLTKSACTFPCNLAIVHGSKELTYGQFNSRVNRLVNALFKLGVKQGDNVAVLQFNYPEMLESIFACFKAGCGAVPINFRLHAKEIAFIIGHSEAKAVILSSEFNKAILDIRDQIPKARHLITLSGAYGELLDYEQLLSRESDKWDDADVGPDDLAWLFYTSGTTGMAKGAMLTHRNLLAMTMSFYADVCPDFGPDDVILHAAPLSHGSGLYALPNIAKAAANIILESKSFDAEQIFKTIQDYKVTNMFGAATMIKMMTDGPAADQYDHSSMKALCYGGGPMMVEDLKKAIAKFGPCMSQVYGQGESPMTITCLAQMDHILSDSPNMKRLASAGVQRTDVEVKIFDPHDNELARGQMGEIVTRSDVVMKGYWRNPEITAKTLKNGWLHTGDIGYIDENGYLFLMDRSKDMIISGGENIYPREIEEVIARHPAVREGVVIGVPDAKWGESIKAIVSLVEGKSVTEEELIAFCKDNIASYKKPKSVDFVDELPKSNYGKILKRELRAKYWKENERNI